jgi:hypothetical protein
MGAPSRLNERIECRYLVVYRADPAVVAALLPEPMLPAVHGAHGLVSVCFTRMSESRRGWLPLSLGVDHLSWRFAVELPVPRTQETRRAVWVPRRHTSSWFGAHCAGRLARGRWAQAQFKLLERPADLELEVTSGDDLELLLRAERGGDLAGSVFASPGDLRAVLGASGPAHPPFALAPGFDTLDLDAERWHLELLRVRELCVPRFEDAERFPPGSLDLDCAVRLGNRRALEVLAATAERRLAVLATGRAGVLPTS